MDDTRRYNESEVAEILQRATEAQESSASTLARAGGLTLGEIQEIGREVGIEPHSIERSARELDMPAPVPEVSFLGTPRSVSRVVPLERNLDDDEWMRLVALLRETFGATGQVEVVGSLRSWYNGNLQVHVEPWEGGHRVRMSTLKGNVVELGVTGLFFLGLAVAMGLLIFLKKGVDAGLVMPAVFGILGLSFPAAARLALPRWAEQRREQMDMIAAEIPRLMGE